MQSSLHSISILCPATHNSHNNAIFWRNQEHFGYIVPCKFDKYAHLYSSLHILNPTWDASEPMNRYISGIIFALSEANQWTERYLN